jgi:MFS family permease
MTADLTPAARHAYAANVNRFYLYKFLNNLHLWLPIWVLYLQEMRGLSLTQVTVLEAPFWLVIILSEVPTGAVADRWGRKISLLLGCLTYSVSIFIFGIAEGFPLLMLSYLIWAISMTLASGADTALAYESLAALGREGEFRKVMGRAQACMIAASLIGLLLGAPLAASTSLTVPILSGAAIGLLAALVVLTLREPPRHEAQERLPYLRVIHEALRYTMRHASLRAMIAVQAVFMAAVMSGTVFIQPFLVQFNVPVADFGLLTAPLRLFSIAGALMAYRLAARAGERRVVYLLAIGLVLALLVLGVVPSLAAVAMFAVLGFCSATVTPIATDFINRHSPQHLRATLASVGQMAFALLLVGALPLTGMLADRTSLQTMFLVTGIAIAALMAISLVAWTSALRREQPQAPAPLMVAGEAGPGSRG